MQTVNKDEMLDELTTALNEASDIIDGLIEHVYQLLESREEWINVATLQNTTLREQHELIEKQTELLTELATEEAPELRELIH